MRIVLVVLLVIALFGDMERSFGQVVSGSEHAIWVSDATSEQGTQWPGQFVAQIQGVPSTIPGTGSVGPAAPANPTIGFRENAIGPGLGFDQTSPRSSFNNAALADPYLRTRGTNLEPTTRYNRSVASSSGRGIRSLRVSPEMMGEHMDAASLKVIVTETVPHDCFVTGTVLSGAGASAVLAFEQAGTDGPNDLFSVGTGQDASGDSEADTFNLLEPLPPNEVPTSPGPGFVYDGGTATYSNGTTTQTAQDGAFPTNTSSVWFAQYSFSRTSADMPPVPRSGGAAVRRIKLSENNSPVPRDRLFFDYRFFKEVIGGWGDVNRFTFGAERTFFNDYSSLEVRLPFAATLDSDQVLGASFARNFEAGNITAIFKDVIWNTESAMASVGLGLTFPSADDSTLARDGVGTILRIKNEAIHILPFAALLWEPNDRFYVQSFLQFDFDTGGDSVFANVNPSTTLPQIGVLQDTAWLFADLSGGYWLYQAAESGSLVQRIAAITELHYSTTLQDADSVSGNGITVTSLGNRLDLLNATAGFHFDTNRNTTVTTAVVAPLRDGDDKRFEYELIVFVNNFF